jgi:hypothetical protein
VAEPWSVSRWKRRLPVGIDPVDLSAVDAEALAVTISGELDDDIIEVIVGPVPDDVEALPTFTEVVKTVGSVVNDAGKALRVLRM